MENFEDLNRFTQIYFGLGLTRYVVYFEQLLGACGTESRLNYLFFAVFRNIYQLVPIFMYYSIASGLISRFGYINYPCKSKILNLIKSVINYLPKCTYHLLYLDSNPLTHPGWILKYNLFIYLTRKWQIECVQMFWKGYIFVNLFIKYNVFIEIILSKNWPKCNIWQFFIWNK